MLPPPPPPSDISPDASTASAMIEKKSSLLTNQILSGLEQRYQQRMANPPAVPHPVVDDSIARRRAELRRLQQKQGGAPGFSGHTASSLARSGIVGSGTSTLASARTRLGGGVGKPPNGAVRPHVEEMVRLASTLPAPSTKTTMPGWILKPMPPTDVVVAAPIKMEVTPPHPTSPVQIPSTATITRRLNYAETTNGGEGVFMPVPRLPQQSEVEHNDEDVIEHHNRRTSEIFPIGFQQPKQEISEFDGGSTAGEKESMTQNNPPPPLPMFSIFSPSGPSERGATIKTISSSETVQVVRSSGVVRVPPMAVPQSSSNSTTIATNNKKTNIMTKSAFTATEINRRRREQRRVTEEKEKETLSAKPSLSPPILVEEVAGLKSEVETTSVVTVTSPINGRNDIDETNSGRDTPVHSNVHEDVQRLKNMLESAERKKKEALLEVEKLKLFLDSVRGDENLLLSSVIPPLTPRSRPGSRAASPEHHLDVSAVPIGRLGGKRINTPLPRPVSSSSVEDIVVEDEYLLKAAQCIPNEYGTHLATYFVRQPYVDDDDDAIVDSGTSWTQYAHISPREEYLRIATTSDPNTLEVLAYVEADRSVFTLMGQSDARHGRPSNSEESSPLEWNVFNNVEDMDRALGKVTHIDADGNERDYWLDSIYEEALTTRESYCMSLISASYVLKEVMRGGSFTAPTGIPLQQSQYDRANDIPQSAEPAYQAIRAINTGNSSTEKSLRHEPLAVQHLPECKLEDTQDMSKLDANESSTKTQPEEELYEPSDSALTFMVLSLFSLLFSIAWFFLIQIPIKICSVLIRFVLMMVILRVLWLLFEDDNGACDIGACIDYKYYNIPGIY